MAEPGSAAAAGLARRSFTHRYPPYPVFFGADGLEHIGAAMAAAGQTSCLLTTGASLGRDEELIARIGAALAPARVVHWPGTRRHCPSETVMEAVAIVRDQGLDAIVAVGGGSTSDHAKALALMLTEQPDVQGLARAGEHYLKLGPIPRRVGIYAAPTTLSGAEVTFGGALILRDPPLKFIFTSESLYPDAIAIDPRLYLATPRPVLLSTGMNALNHAVERFLNAAAQPLADSQFVYAARALFECLPVVQRGEGEAWEEAVALGMLAAHLSESTNVFAGLAHACCHVLGVRTGAEHGVLNGIVLPHAISSLTGASRDRAQALAQAIGVEGELGAAIGRLLAELALPTRLRDVGLDRAEIDAVIADVAEDFSFEPGTGRERIVRVIEAAW